MLQVDEFMTNGACIANSAKRIHVSVIFSHFRVCFGLQYSDLPDVLESKVLVQT